MSAYPDWVRKFRVKGTAIKKVGNNYYLYQHYSKYVKGKKYPQCFDHYLGVITPDGVVYSQKKNVSLENIQVFEYGFSFSLLCLLPDEWKKALEDDWYIVFLSIIHEISPESYLLMDFQLPKDIHRNISLHKKKLMEMIDFEQLAQLKTIYLIVFTDRKVLSKISDEQMAILNNYHIMIGGALG